LASHNVSGNSEHTLFGEMSPSSREIVERHFTESTSEAGQREALAPGVWILAEGRGRSFTVDGIAMLDPGAILGAESLWSTTPTPLQIEAITACRWRRLSIASFRALSELDAGAALNLLVALLRSGAPTAAATASATAYQATLLAQPLSTQAHAGNVRRHPTRDSVVIALGGRELAVPAGTKFSDLLPERHEGFPVVAALVDNKTTSLNTHVTSSCRLEALTTRHWEGQRIYRHSLALLALEAGRNVAPELTVRMGPSIGFGRRILAGKLMNSELRDFAAKLEAEMQRLRSTPLEVSEERWTVDEARDYFSSQGWDHARQLLETWRDPMVPMVSYGNVYVLNTTPVVTRSSTLDGCFILCDENLILLVYGKRSPELPRPSRTLPQSVLNVVGDLEQPEPRSTHRLLLGQAHANRDVERDEQAWLQTLGVTSVGAFNRACVTASVPGLIRVAEGFQEKRLTVIADEIQRRGDEVDIVCIAGPSASGKTTFIRRLCVQLQVNGIQPVALGLDDYYVDRERTPLDDTGDYDFESLTALQLPLLEEHLSRLLAGELVKTARYDFSLGRSHTAGGPEIRLRPRDVLLLEGIHGLNPALLGSIPARRVFRIFVCPLMQLAFDQLSSIHASDVRLIRRIVRDRHARGYGAAETIARWPKVRMGERQHIYPFQANSDAVFDSALVYELSVLRVFAERYLLEVPDSHTSYATAFRLMHLLDRFVSIYPDHVPATSILREFVGGSGFDG